MVDNSISQKLNVINDYILIIINPWEKKERKLLGSLPVQWPQGLCSVVGQRINLKIEIPVLIEFIKKKKKIYMK